MIFPVWKGDGTMFWNEGIVAGHCNCSYCVFAGERGKRSGKSSKPAG